MAATKKKNAKKTGQQDQLHDEGYKAILSKAAHFLYLLKKYFNVPWIDGVTVDDIEPVNIPELADWMKFALKAPPEVNKILQVLPFLARRQPVPNRLASHRRRRHPQKISPPH